MTLLLPFPVVLPEMQVLCTNCPAVGREHATITVSDPLVEVAFPDTQTAVTYSPIAGEEHVAITVSEPTEALPPCMHASLMY